MNTTHAVRLGDRGRLVIPAELRAHQSWHQGTPLVMVETEAGVIMASRDRMKSLVRRQLNGGAWWPSWSPNGGLLTVDCPWGR